MRNNKLTLIRKLRIVDEAAATGNIKATARKFKIQPCQIRKWRANYLKIKEQAAVSPRKLTVHTGRKLVHADLEDEIDKWIETSRDADLAVSTQDIIDRAVCLNPTFRDACPEKLFYWVHQFMRRRGWSVRCRTRVSQQTRVAMEAVKRDFCRRVMSTYKNRIKEPQLFVNMDEIAVYLNASPKRTVHRKGDRTVSIRIGGTSSMRFTLAVTVAMDGTKLPLFVIFKGKPGGNIEKALPEILPEGVVGCVQSKGWMDNRTMGVWYEKVYRPYLAGQDGEAALLLDDFVYHKSAAVQQMLASDNSIRIMILPHYTCILQSCDVGINKSLKDCLKKYAAKWRRQRHVGLAPGQRMPAPSRKDVLTWLKLIWDEFPTEIVQNSFSGSGYVYEEGVDYSAETESDSEGDSNDE